MSEVPQPEEPVYSGAIDPIGNRGAVSGTPKISGWAFSAAARVVQVDACIGAVSLGSLAFGIERHDVAQAYHHPDALRSGYEGFVQLGSIPLGEHLLRVRVMDAIGDVHEFSQAIVIVESPIQGVLDEPPVDGATAATTLHISGWALSTAAPIARVEALIDGVDVGMLRYGSERPDVARAHRIQRLAYCGYADRIRLDGLPHGEKTLSLRVTDEQGNRRDFVRGFQIAPPTAQMHLDSPQSGDSSAGVIEVHGWVIGGSAPIVEVRAFLGEISLGALPYGIQRKDVAESRPEPQALRSGFHGMVQFPVDRPGNELLIVRATDADGAATEVAAGIHIVAHDEPLAEIERIAWRGNCLDIEGWALLPGGASSLRARLFIGARSVGETRINLSRPDIARRFPNNRAAYRCGFRFAQPFIPLGETEDGCLNLIVAFDDREGRHFERHARVPYETHGHWIGSAQLWAQLADLIADFQRRTEHDPAILDWDTDLGLAAVFPHLAVFSPPQRDPSSLPYIDQSIDIVVGPVDAVAVAEARRVATAAVLGAWGMESTTHDRAGLPGTRRLPLKLRREWEADWLNDEHAVRSRASATIIIPVHNNVAYTQACLARLQMTLPPDFRGEIIVVDDASSDDTPAVLRRWAALAGRHRILREEANVGFLHCCNRGANAASGGVLIFLNNDALPNPGWFPAIMRPFRDDPGVGAVGGKLLYPDGTLQEAGGVIFRDGSGYNFGRHDPDPDAPLYSYLREVDYCSGALLATRRDLFLAVGGFDPRFAPAYYEDTDYCFSLRERGYRVLYQPESTAIHFEGASSGTDLTQGVKHHQVANRAKFVEKWAPALAAQPTAPEQFDLATRYALATRSRIQGEDATAHGQ